jgi:hypothetical protein
VLYESFPTVPDSEYGWVPVESSESWFDKSRTYPRRPGKPWDGWSRSEVIVVEWVRGIHEYL